METEKYPEQVKSKPDQLHYESIKKLENTNLGERCTEWMKKVDQFRRSTKPIACINPIITYYMMETTCRPSQLFQEAYVTNMFEDPEVKRRNVKWKEILI
ncbi:25479_t:CDS:2 [Dentiscutata erythropus]|uniref:25479_t:CDS:1 n=1 Tax=Dentiscutata erythropus TaxID=1348616 RepID=A0A9N9DIS3_9GLOM|nr:25479_t:CDS:2 [Dentiscutata erythropus]